jgi:hypothetical protein
MGLDEKKGKNRGIDTPHVCNGGVSVGALTPYMFFWCDDTLYEVCGNRDGDVCGYWFPS